MTTPVSMSESLMLQRPESPGLRWLSGYRRLIIHVWNHHALADPRERRFGLIRFSSAGLA